MGSAFVLAHDLGTTGDKASLFDARGQCLASAFHPYPTQHPHPGWAEQDPSDWWQAVCITTRKIIQSERCRPEDIAGVGFSGQMMGLVAVDGTIQPLRPAIIWADQRAEVETRLVAERISPTTVYQITGHRLSPSYTGAKALWLQRHEPDIWDKTRHILQAKDYIAYRLCNEIATDHSDASGTNLFDLHSRRWSPELIDAFALNASLLPPAVPSATIIGRVSSEAAQATGLAAGTPVIIGGGDGACATVGAGATRPGDAYLYVGSSSWISVVAREALYDPQQRTFTFAHLDPQLVFPTGTMQSAGAAFDWLENLFRGTKGEPIHQDLINLAENVPCGSRGLLFLPYLQGERSPHWSAHARACFIGLNITHGRAELTRAALEGVAFNLRAIYDAFREQGVRIATLRVIGGGMRSSLWRQILADVLEISLLCPELLVEATSLGAAIATAIGVGLLESYADAGALVPIAPGEVPHPETSAIYQRGYRRFCRAYERLQDLFEEIGLDER